MSSVAGSPGGGRRVRPFGDGALVAEVASAEEARRLAAAVEDRTGPGVEDVVVGYRSVTVVADPDTADMAAIAAALASDAPASAAGGEPRAGAPRPVDIPVTFDGPDLDDVAAGAGVTPERVVAALTERPLPVALLGFLPGFAYLDGLPPALAEVPRRATPRPQVPAGSVGMAGGFAGIYPQASPGGWQWVGRSSVTLFDPTAPPYATLRPGDLVRFRAVAEVGPPPHPARRGPLDGRAARHVEVEAAGVLSLVQDGGRRGVAGLGVPRAGAADPVGLRSANRLVGNADGAAAIEVNGAGPSLRFACRAHVVVVGGVDVAVDGRAVTTDAVVPVEPGQVLTVGTVRAGLRAYVGIDGGVDVPAVLGSRSSDVLTGLGIGPLRVGDTLDLGAARRPRGRLVGATASAGPSRLRVMPGPDDFPSGALDRLVDTPWQVSPASDRMGVRLRGGPLPTPGPVASRAMVTGAVQVPPDGQPVVLLCDHATVGGYPVVATVVLADLGVLGRCRARRDCHFQRRRRVRGGPSPGRCRPGPDQGGDGVVSDESRLRPRRRSRAAPDTTAAPHLTAQRRRAPVATPGW